MDVSDEGENFISMTRLEGELRCRDDPAVMEMDPQKDCASGRKRGAVAREVAGGPASAKKKTKSLKENEIHSEAS